MDRKSMTIKNVDSEVVDLLTELRITERRQLAAILEDCVNAYGDAVDDEGYRDDAAIDAAE